LANDRERFTFVFIGGPGLRDSAIRTPKSAMTTAPEPQNGRQCNTTIYGGKRDLRPYNLWAPAQSPAKRPERRAQCRAAPVPGLSAP